MFHPNDARRFWICKIVIVIMDLAIFRGAVSMGEEFCSQVSSSLLGPVNPSFRALSGRLKFM